MNQQNRLSKYPPIDCYDSQMLDVGQGHEIYFEQSGNPEGKPVIYLHGGPGGTASADSRQFWDPKLYRIVMFDQRGCGKSRPPARLENNTTWDLVKDIEKIREELKIEKWQVFGGSWGSTLSLTYAISHPERVTELILRGIFLIREREIQWFYQEGCSRMYPDAWENYLAPIPEDERHDLLKAYHERLTSEDESTRLEAARAWSLWEASTSSMVQNEEKIKKFTEPEMALAFARIECHYFTNKGFFERDGWLLEKQNINKIRHIPAIIIQGRQDLICPPESAWALHKVWPEAELKIVQDAAHAASEPGIVHELIQATNKFINL
jgi:proline iminopeptidase